MDTTHSRLITIFFIQALDLLRSITEDHNGLFWCNRLEVSKSTSDALVVSNQVIRIELCGAGSLARTYFSIHHVGVRKRGEKRSLKDQDFRCKIQLIVSTN